MSLYTMGQKRDSVKRKTIQAVGLLIMTGDDMEAGEADETADVASSAPGEFSCLCLCSM